MANLQRMLKKTGRRVTLGVALNRAALGVFIAGGLGVVLVAIERIAAFDWPWLLYPIVCGAGGILGIGHAIVTRPRRAEIAVLIDHRLHLKDRVGTAEAIDRGVLPPSPFLALARRDAERMADRIHVRTAAPIQLSRAWGGAAAVSALLAVAVVYLPAVAWGHEETPQLSPEDQQELAENQVAIADTLEDIVSEIESTDEAMNETVRRDLQRLQELADQMQGQAADSGELREARDESAARLDDLADTFEADADADRAADEAVRERFQDLESLQPDRPGSELTDALKRGDFQEAQERLDDLMNAMGSLSQEDRAALAEELRSLSDQLRDAQETAREEQDADDGKLREALRRQGINDSTIDDLLNDEGDPDPPDTQNDLEREGVDSEVARDLSDEIEDNRADREAEDQADQDTQRMSDSLDDLADEVEQTPPAEDENTNQDEAPDQQTGDADDQSDERGGDEAGDEENEGTGDRDDQQDQTGQETGDENAERTQDQTGDERREGDAGEETRETSDQQQQDQTGEGQQEQQQTETDETGEREQEQQQTGEGEEGERRPGETGEGQQEDPTGGEEQDVNEETEGGDEEPPQEGDPDEAIPGEGPPDEAIPGEGGEEDSEPGETTEGEQPPPDQPGEPGQQEQEGGDPGEGEGESGPIDTDNLPSAEEMKKILQEMRQRRDDAEQKNRDSQKIREAAKEIAEKLTPEERRRMEEWAREMQKELDESDQDSMGDGAGTGPGAEGEGEPGNYQPEAVEDLDLRGDETADRVLAEILSDRELEGDPGRTDKPSRDGVVRDARRAAERAVNNATVHRRYHDLIRRYFDQLDETIDQAAETPPKTGSGADSNSGDSASSEDGSS